MKWKPISAAVIAFTLSTIGCGHQQTDAEGIRAGIINHLTALKTLNLSAMDIHVQNINVQGNQAQAQVEFLPKTGAPSGAGMQVSYALLKQNGTWIVDKTLATGGVIEHPTAGANPHVAGDPATSFDITAPPKFNDLVHRNKLPDNTPTAPAPSRQ